MGKDNKSCSTGSENGDYGIIPVENNPDISMADIYFHTEPINELILRAEQELGL